MNLTSSNNYKNVLATYIRENKQVYGYKSRLAKAAGCQKSFLSSVLNSHVHLTPEHAVGLANFWGLSDIDRDYFVGLVNLARAGTEDLKSYIQEKLGRLRREQEHFAKRYKQKHLAEDSPHGATYYASWVYSAAHILLTIPKFRSTPALAKRLNIAEDFAGKILESLRAMGLIEHSKGQWKVIENDIHLGRESIMNFIHATQWRQQATNNILLNDPDSIHYTAVHSLSLDDIQRLRSLIFEMIDKSKKIVNPSKEEELVCLTCDFFVV